MTTTESVVLEGIAADIRAQVDEGIERLDTARIMALAVWSRRQTERKFRDYFLTSPARYFRDYQTELAGTLLAQGEDVLSASTSAGFTSPGRLHDAVVVRYGMTPGEMRQRGAGVHIHFGFFQTQVGVVMLAATARGLCWLSICGLDVDADTLGGCIDDLRATYPNASFDEQPEQLQDVADQLVAFLDDRTPRFCPTLDILEGTTFQREVWAELQRIAPGETVSYSELAQRIGNPKAVRAVAQACARNNVAIAIPCHRCIRSDGSLSGYRWGIEWKARLLEIERELHQRRSASLA